MVEQNGTDSAGGTNETADSVGETEEIPVELLAEVLDDLLASVAGLLALLPHVFNDIEQVATGDTDADKRLRKVIEGFAEGNETGA